MASLRADLQALCAPSTKPLAICVRMSTLASAEATTRKRHSFSTSPVHTSRSSARAGYCCCCCCTSRPPLLPVGCCRAPPLPGSPLFKGSAGFLGESFKGAGVDEAGGSLEGEEGSFVGEGWTSLSKGCADWEGCASGFDFLTGMEGWLAGWLTCFRRAFNTACRATGVCAFSSCFSHESCSSVSVLAAFAGAPAYSTQHAGIRSQACYPNSAAGNHAFSSCPSHEFCSKTSAPSFS
mmetsp:Transcript_8899/g.22435  ORF Transcript_8899/g.22435 Transcript_8899/m.22435 type:complete len:237 (-) Transcript_8899:2236-2946(-)